VTRTALRGRVPQGVYLDATAEEILEKVRRGRVTLEHHIW
jgi:hypothetical protein